MSRFGLRDDQWDRIKDLLPGRPGMVGVTAADNRLFVGAVLYRYRTGIPWRDLPARFGDWKNVHRRFSRWGKSGVWERIFQDLAAGAANEYVMIDSTIVGAHQHSAGAKKRRREPGDRPVAGRAEHQDPRSGRCSGHPLNFFLMGGDAHDLVGADRLLPTIQAGILIAYRAFDADQRVLEPLAAVARLR